MEYQALYRRWRPRNFNDFVGQSHVVTTLYNAIQSKRIAHAYLFTGPRGTGKTSIAKIFAKAVNCADAQSPDPCDQCSNCTRINDGIFLDVQEIDAASNRGVDEIRDLREKVKFSPSEGRYKIYIIDEVHMLTTEAFNALLKTLEEPPQFVVFILATTEAHKIPATILSRCQRFDFKRFTVAEISGRLAEIATAEGLEATERSLQLIAEHAEGGMRDALGLLEQAAAHSQGKLTEDNVRAILGLTDREEIAQLTRAIAAKNLPDALGILNALAMDGKDLFQFGRSLTAYLREMLLAEVAQPDSGGPAHRVESQLSPEELVEMIEVIAAATGEVKRSLLSSLPLELAFIKLIVPRQKKDQLEQRIARLEASLPNSRPAITPEGQNRNESAPSKPVAPVPPAVAAAPAGPATLPKTTGAIAATTVTGVQPGVDWETFLEALKKKKRTLAALVQEGKLVRCDGDEFIIGIPANLKFHLENLALGPNQELLEAAVEELCGKKMKLSCVPLADGQPVKAPAEQQPGQPDLLKKTIELFGGEARPIIKEEIKS